MDGNPFQGWVERFASLLEEGAAITARPPPRPAAGTRTALIFAPHPDDEVIIGALPLRLQRECGFRVVSMAVTLGSRVDRREVRWGEAALACASLGFDLVTPDRAGLQGISPAGKEADPDRWRRAISACATLVAQICPDVVFLPHEADWNQTHIGVHSLALAVLREVTGLRCLIAETEFWGAMASPNLMVESSSEDVADLVAALSLHEGEIARNPYHLLLPPWMMDNVRRGTELVGGQGGPAPGFVFATLYRLRAWQTGALHDMLPSGIMVSKQDDLAALFERPLPPGEGRGEAPPA